MPRKSQAAPAAAGQVTPGGASGVERDLVTFYSRLTHTLEKAAGRGELAARLAESRHGPAGRDEAGLSAEPALARTLRRLGRIGPDDDAPAFAREYAERVGAAVARPGRQVFLLLRLFSAGEEALGLTPVCGANPLCHNCLLTRECEHFNNPRKPELAALAPALRLRSGNDQALSDAELLAVLLFGGKATGLEPVVLTLLKRYGRLRAVFRAGAQEFAGIRGMGDGGALRLAALTAMHRRLLAERRDEMLHIGSAGDIHDRYAAELRDHRSEAAVLLMLDRGNHVIRDAWFCDGSAGVAGIAIPDLLRPAVREFACRIALVHNHPSGDASPSDDDLRFTRRLLAACDIMGLTLVDHVIVAESDYFSFAGKGLLEAEVLRRTDSRAFMKSSQVQPDEAEYSEYGFSCDYEQGDTHANQPDDGVKNFGSGGRQPVRRRPADKKTGAAEEEAGEKTRRNE